MLSFKEHTLLSEKFKNFIGFQEPVISQKEKYANEVYDMLNAAYSAIGGVRGSGFESPEAMAKKIRFWKLGFKGGVLKSVILFKDKKGRKAVAMATDGTKEGKMMLVSVLKADLPRAYKELSDGIWAFSRKYIGDEVLLKFVIPVSKVGKLLNKEVIPLKDMPDKVKAKFDRKDPFYNYYYGREIQGHMHVKIGIGTDGLPIKDK